MPDTKPRSRSARQIGRGSSAPSSERKACNSRRACGRDRAFGSIIFRYSREHRTTARLALTACPDFRVARERQTLTTLGRAVGCRVMRQVAIVALLALVGACSDACSNTMVVSAAAPNGQHSAVLFQRDCGATTSFSTQVSIIGPGDEASDGGIAFRADDDHGAASAGSWGGPWAEVKWLAADHLLISYAAKSRIFQQTDRVNGVRITYQAVAR